jgi:peptidoglycan hydrolase CwlO-like protein
MKLVRLTSEIRDIEKKRDWLKQEFARSNISQEEAKSELNELDKQLVEKWREYDRIQHCY